MVTPRGIDVALPPHWADAIATTVRRRRVLLVGPTDAGKSSFARALLAAWQEAGPLPALLDADPGQKMIGPPGTVALGAPGALTLRAFRFVGTTSGAAVREIVAAVGTLAHQAGKHPLIINTSGLIHGPGIALLMGAIRAADVDAVVAIDWPADLALRLDRTDLPVCHVRKAPAARRKGQGERARNRREAFRAYFADASAQALPRAAVDATPVQTTCLAEPAARPLCALVSQEGADLSLGVLVDADHDAWHVVAPLPSQPVASLRLGAMWARPGPAGWELLDRLLPVG